MNKKCSRYTQVYVYHIHLSNYSQTVATKTSRLSKIHQSFLSKFPSKGFYLDVNCCKNRRPTLFFRRGFLSNVLPNRGINPKRIMTESVRMAWNIRRKYVILVEYNYGFLYTSINVAFWYCTNMTLGTQCSKRSLSRQNVFHSQFWGE